MKPQRPKRRMTKTDRNNFNYLMNCSPEKFDEWIQEASNDDVDYALELFRFAKLELMVEQMELQEMAIMFEDDTIEAKQIIDRIKKL